MQVVEFDKMNSIKDKIDAILIDSLEIENPQENTLFDKDNYDSFVKMNLLISLEMISDQEISIEELLNCKTVGDIYSIFEKPTREVD
jgi:acyl carrier protein